MVLGSTEAINGLGMAIGSHLTIQAELATANWQSCPCAVSTARDPATLAFLALLDQQYPPDGQKAIPRLTASPP
jgi:hypothetical protein